MTLLIFTQARAVARQSALEPGGPAAAEIRWLWDVMLWIGSGTTALVVVLIAGASETTEARALHRAVPFVS